MVVMGVMTEKSTKAGTEETIEMKDLEVSLDPLTETQQTISLEFLSHENGT